MIVSENINDYLFEGKQVGILYHYTDFSAAENILESRKIRSDMGGPVGTLDDPYYTISFTRDKNFHKVKRWLTYTSNIECRFVINGDKLSNNFKIRPFAQHSDKGHYNKNSEKYESEEIFISQKPLSVDIIKYVIRIDLLESPKRDIFDKWRLEDFNNVVKNAKKLNIPLQLVDNNGNPIPYKKRFLNIF